GVYSAVVVWNSVFGGNSASPGSPGYIPNTDEGTHEAETTNYKGNFPTGFCLKSGGCAQFFGGVTRSSSHALMWQWSGGGGQTNGIGGFNGDLDQIDGARHPEGEERGGAAGGQGPERDVRGPPLPRGEPPLVAEQGEQGAVVAPGQHLARALTRQRPGSVRIG